MTSAREQGRKFSVQPGSEPGRQVAWLISRGGPIEEVAELSGLNPLAVGQMGRSAMRTRSGSERLKLPPSNPLTVVFASELIQTGIVGPDQPDIHWNKVQRLLREPDAPALSFSAQITTEAYARARSDEQRGDSSAKEIYVELAQTLGVRRVTAPDVRSGERLIDGLSDIRPVLDADKEVINNKLNELVTEYGSLHEINENRRGQIESEVMSTIRPFILRYCQARIGRNNPVGASAEDVTQEILISALQAMPTYQDTGKPFLAFVYGIASHKVIDSHRKKGRSRSDTVAEVPEVVDGNGPQEETLLRESTDEMVSQLSKLPQKQREILILRVVDGLSAEETAEAVGSTPGAVRVAQHRALTRLRYSLDQNPDTSDHPSSEEPSMLRYVGGR